MAAVDGQFAPRDVASYSSGIEKRTLDGSLARLEIVSSNPPTIGNISPAAGTITRTQTVSLRVTDSLGLASVVIVADYSSGKTATISDGSTFQPGFTSGSSRTPVTGGHDYVLAEDGGWFDSFTLRTVAVNTSGVVASSNAALAYTVSNPGSAIAPALSNVSPANLSAITRTTAVTFDVSHALGHLGTVVLWATHADGRKELVHDGTAFSSAYSAGSARSGVSNGYHFSLVRAGDWPTSTLGIAAAADDTAQGVTVLSLSFTVSNPPAPPDVVAPAISNIDPDPGTPIGRLDPVFFDVTDANLGRTIVAARFADGGYEVVHDGDGFASGYAALSTRAAISGGFSYRVRRTAGWPSGPTIAVWAVDTLGNAT